MSKQDALFLLIKSLSPGEKAAVRQIEQQQAGYIALFDLISRQNDYDERKLKKKLASLGHDINFAYAKNYLSKHILRTLREQRASAGLERTVQEVTILMERKVFGLADKILTKARETAWKEERWTQFLELTQIELALTLQESGGLDAAIQRIQQINEDRKVARARLQNLGEYEDLYALYRPVVKRKQLARNHWDLDLVQDFRKHPLLLAPASAQSARALRMHYLCRVLVYAYLGEYKDAHTLIQSLLAHYAAHPFLLEDHPAEYLNDLLREGGMQLHFKNFAGVEAALAAIRAFQQQRAIHGAEFFDKYYRLLIGLAIESKDRARIKAEWPQIREGLKTYQDALPWASRSTLMFLLARLQFEQGEMTEARLLLEEILSEAQPGVREDIVSLSRLLLVFIYFEKGSYDLAESASRAAKKYLERREQLFAFERRILRFFEAKTFVAGTRDEISALESLRDDLKGIFKDKLEANILAFFDITGWLDQRVRKLKK